MFRRYWLQAFVVAAVVGLLAAFLTISHGQTSAGHDVQGFPQPQVRHSSDGILHTTLHARIAENKLVDQVSGENEARPHSDLRGDHSGAHVGGQTSRHVGDRPR